MPAVPSCFANPVPAPSIYACAQPRTTRPLSELHRNDRYQPRDLRTAVRWVHGTSTHKLMLALAYLNGHEKAPVRKWTTDTGARYVDDGHSGRVFEVAAAIERIEAAGLDPNIVMVLRGAYVGDEDVFAVLSCGTDKQTAHGYWMDPRTIPDVRAMLTVAALRGVDVSPTVHEA